MGSKRNKKAKHDMEMFSGSNNEDDGTTEPEINDSEIENNGINKSTKRKRKHEDKPKKSKKSNNIDAEGKKMKSRRKKIKEDLDVSEAYQENEETDIDGEVKIEICENPAKTENKDDNPDKKKEEITWPETDLMELITRMELNIPEKDTLAYSTRAEKLNWDNVAFNDYTSDDCKKMWGLVQKRIRRFRLLSEVLTDARCWIINPKAKHRTVGRVRKHPDMPRRPLSSYLLFYLKARDRIISENPELEGGDITKYMGQVYKSLPPDQREQYEREAASNKEEYHEKLRVFFENHPEMAPPSSKVAPKVEKDKPVKVEKEKPKLEKKDKPRPSDSASPSKPEKSAKSERDRPRPEKEKARPGPGRPPKSDKERREKPKTPKRCQTAFGLYYESELKNTEEGIDKLAFKEKCKEDWKQFTDKKKLPWINLADQDLFRYNDEIKKYKANHPESQVHEIKSNLTKEERQIKQLSSGKPIKPPNSAYGLYSKILLQSEEIKVVHPKDRMNFIANKWKNATEEVRNSLRDKTISMMDKYKLEYATYLESLPEDKRKLEVQIKQKLKPGPKPGSKRKPRKPARSETKTAPTKTKFKEPEQPPISPAKYFASLFKGEGDPIQAWKALTTDEKHRYEEELTKKKQAYIVEFEKFLKSLTKEELEAFSKSRQQRVKSDEESSECSSDSGNEDADDENDDENEISESGTE